VRAAAPTWRAAGALRSEGLHATSVARLLAELDREVEAGRDPLRRDSVLLIDEAGMVDSAALARLIDHAREADAKLVLIGDPAQLGEIEAGGLFGSLVSRTDPVFLEEVIRHEHELDREGARRIREGRGAEAIEAYRSEGRVVVSPDPEVRREEMVRDWWRSWSDGEDALMIAKRNAEVARLNAVARQMMKTEGRLGEREIQVGDGGFTAGDQVITRVNDHQARIYNRERWLIESVDQGARRVELVGIDASGRRAVVDADYLGRVNASDGSPALQHAYAATTYQAQGSTVDRAYVMADPSMDRQETYVAASRSRQETWFYATPDIDLERAEFAPSSRRHEGLDHIAAAAERDGAQVSAHDEALRTKFEGLCSPQLVRLRDELASEVGAEGRIERRRSDLDEGIARSEDQIERVKEERVASGERPRWGREARREYDGAMRILEVDERLHRRTLERFEGELAELPLALHDARAERAVIDAVIDRRVDLALAAARVSAPDHIVAELGERPPEGRERLVWDEAVRDVEGFRQKHGLRDRDTSLGVEPTDPGVSVEYRRVQDSVRWAQRQLGIEQERTIQRERAMEIEL
jgi:hypothetical protein